ncbi:hypothetical protein pb186bvf_015556 [Paramecium bursaria]
MLNCNYGQSTNKMKQIFIDLSDTHKFINWIRKFIIRTLKYIYVIQIDNSHYFIFIYVISTSNEKYGIDLLSAFQIIGASEVFDFFLLYFNTLQQYLFFSQIQAQIRQCSLIILFLTLQTIYQSYEQIIQSISQITLHYQLLSL